jgi:hypothetical protein
MSSTSDDSAPSTRRVSRANDAGPLSRYRVQITYREPGYAEHSGTDKPYTGRFIVQAADERDAIARAKAEFEEIARRSGVGWVRIIQRVDCEKLDAS